MSPCRPTAPRSPDSRCRTRWKTTGTPASASRAHTGSCSGSPSERGLTTPGTGAGRTQHDLGAAASTNSTSSTALSGSASEMIGADDEPVVGTVEAPVLVEPEVEGVHRRHRRVDVVFEGFLDTAGECRQHEHGFEVLLVQDLHPRIAVLVLGMVGQPVDLHQRRRVDTLGNLTAEQQIQTTRLDDRVERRIRDEVVDRRHPSRRRCACPR